MAMAMEEDEDLSKKCCGIIVPRLENIVSTVNLDCKLSLQRIILKARNAEFNPNRFSAVIMRIKKPESTSLIFASGKLVWNGAKTEEE
ncbi:hypothetical protein JCGZ_05434 [Jatropha curcas]|uniref:Uncharacterized protein n=1 Tax=Jatropha curcas TaxID=180498 RepID=A0A067L6B2_JATCU|nr:hypothetical protein JCGZ_05434 [Jatropha curcas]